MRKRRAEVATPVRPAPSVHLTHASVERLPSFGDPLDAILAVNSVGF
ncbi:hypothetical protein AB0G15_42135 [Streptosporangium sp. NPDC023825]